MVARRGLREDLSLLVLFWLEDQEAEAKTKESSMYLSLHKEKAPGAEQSRMQFFLGSSSTPKEHLEYSSFFNKLISTARSEVASA